MAQRLFSGESGAGTPGWSRGLPLSFMPAYQPPMTGLALPSKPYTYTYSYGATGDNVKGELEAQYEEPVKPKEPAGFSGFTDIDYFSMVANLVAPLVVFVIVYLLIGFYFHYTQAAIDWIILVVLFAALTLAVYHFYVKEMLRVADGKNDHKSIWAAVMVIGVLLAYFGGLAFGWWNYGHQMMPTYLSQELNSYAGVDPSTAEGKAYMDAGTITFKAGSHLDFSKTAGFMNLDMYCVAPIVSSGAANASYNFWAVGVNCCTGAPDSFACGQARKTDATTAGLRLMSDSQLPFFEMAVTKAATEYGIKSDHPIFVHYVQDAKEALSNSASTGWNNLGMAIVWFAIVQAIVVIVGAAGVMIVKSKYSGN